MYGNNWQQEKERQGVESKICFVTFPKTKRQFFKWPKKKIDKRKSRKVISKNATNQIKHGTDKATARRKEEQTRDLPQIKAEFQKDRHKFIKNAYIFWQKIRYRDEEKLVKK